MFEIILVSCLTPVTIGEALLGWIFNSQCHKSGSAYSSVEKCDRARYDAQVLTDKIYYEDVIKYPNVHRGRIIWECRTRKLKEI